MIVSRSVRDALAHVDEPSFYTPWWLDRLAALDEVLFDVERTVDDTLALPQLVDCGITSPDLARARHEEGKLRAMLGDGLVNWLVDTRSPTPPRWTTSITHLYSLALAGWPKPRAEQRGALVEWGGGFGNMVRLTQQFDDPPVHIVFDSPTMLALQYAYLADVGVPTANPPNVWLHGTKELHVAADVDTFIATWSLDECSQACQDTVIDADWFGARTVLIAMSPGKDLFPETGLYHRLLRLGFDETAAWDPGSVYLRWDRP